MPINEDQENSYENVRTILDEDVRKIIDNCKSGDTIQYSFYLKQITDALRQEGFKARPGLEVEHELIRIYLFLEDQDLLSTMPEWLAGSMDSNPAFFNKLYRPYIYKVNVEDSSSFEKAHIPEYQHYNMRILEGKVTEGEQTSLSIEDLDAELTIQLDRLKSVRNQQIQEIVQQISNKLLSSDLSNASDVMSVIGENKVLRQMLTICYSQLGVTVQVTGIDYDEKLAGTKELSFNEKDASYSLEQFRNGCVSAGLKIASLKQSYQEHLISDKKLKEVEKEKQNNNSEMLKLRSSLDQIKGHLEIEKSKPTIKDSKALLYRIAWDDNQVRYYLGTTADENEKTSSGTYKVSTLVKSTKKTDSIIFKTIEDLQNQLEKAVHFYKSMNRKQLISMVNLESAYVLELREYENRNVLKKTIVRNH